MTISNQIMLRNSAAEQSYSNSPLQSSPGQIFITLRHIFYYHARQKYFIKL